MDDKRCFVFTICMILQLNELDANNNFGNQSKN